MDITWSEAILSLGIGVGLAAATGLRVFLPLLVLGIAARLEWLPLAGGFSWLSSSPVLLFLVAATVLEVIAYYIPVIDNFLDFIAGPLAVIAGVLATAAVTTEFPPGLRWSLAIIAGGGTAGAFQTLTSIVRLKSTAFTAGLGNFLIATVEFLGSLAVSLIAILAPAIAIAAVIILLIVLISGRNGLRKRRLSSKAFDGAR